MSTTPPIPPPSASMDLNASFGPTALPSSALVGLAQLSPPGENSDYDNWELSMSGSIYGAGLRHLLEPSTRDLSQPESHWKRQNDGVCSVLLRYAHPDNYVVMRTHMGNAAAMWSAISDLHNDSSVASKLLILRRLISCQLIGEDIYSHVTQVEKLGSRLGQLCAKSPLTLDDIICASLSASLPNDWNSTISPLLSQKSISSTMIATVLRREGVRRRDHTSANEVGSVVLVRQEDMKKKSSSRTVPSDRNSKTSLSCKHCNIVGHSWQNCNKLARQWLAQTIASQPGATKMPPLPATASTRTPTANLALHRASPIYHPPQETPSEVNLNDSTTFFQPDGAAFSLALNTAFIPQSEQLWILDSGCSHSCVTNLPVEKFSSLSQPIEDRFIQVANGENVKITKQSKIALPWNKSLSFTVIEVPSIRFNLLSVTQLKNLGFCFTFLRDKINITDGAGNVVASGVYEQGLPILRERNRYEAHFKSFSYRFGDIE